MDIERLQFEVSNLFQEKKWNSDNQELNFYRNISAISEETGECIDTYRRGKLKMEWVEPKMDMGDFKGSKPDGLPAELADVLLNVLAVANLFDIDMAPALNAKMRFLKHLPVNESKDTKV